MTATELPDDNPFARPSHLPFGLPDFARITPAHFLPAVTVGMAQHRTEINAVVMDPATPTFANTIEPIERSGRLLTRVVATFYNLVSADTSAELDALQTTLAPMLAEHANAIYLNSALYARVATLLNDATAAQRDQLEPEQQRLLETYYRRFTRAGAGLGEAAKNQLRALSTELAELSARFDQLLVADSVATAVRLSDAADLDGLSEGDLAAAEQAAKDRGLPGFLLTLGLPTNQPLIEHLNRRDVRRRLFQASTSRGAHGDDFDTRATALRMVQLRAHQAELLGYPTYADYVVAEGTARTLSAVDEMFSHVIQPARHRADAEAAELAELMHADGVAGPLQPWDWPYYARQLREQRLGVETTKLRPYFELNNVVREGIFYAAQQLYGLSFTPRDDLRGYRDDVQIYEVRTSADKPCGLLLTDWYTRDTKRGGAWMNSFVDQSRLLHDSAVVVINLNLTKPAPGAPTLLTPDEVDTAFHEFGHVLHGLLSDVTYPSQSGTNVPRDFVEFPSQVNEMWAWRPELLSRYARHIETGEKLPAEWIALLEDANRFGQGFATTEYTAAALLDLAWHRLDTTTADALTPDEVLVFEERALAEVGIDHPLIPPRYRTSYFQHVFGGDYSANYWAYLWSEVLDADTVDWFTENGGLLRANGERFATELLSRGDSRDPMVDFIKVRGRSPRIEPLLRRRGLLEPPQSG